MVRNKALQSLTKYKRIQHILGSLNKYSTAYINVTRLYSTKELFSVYFMFKKKKKISIEDRLFKCETFHIDLIDIMSIMSEIKTLKF